MQQLRDLLRNNLSRSLAALSPLDRLAAAWPVAAGHAIAERSSIQRLEGTVATAEVTDPAWLRQLREMTPQLRGDLSRVSGVTLTDILFLSPNPASYLPTKILGSPTRPPKKT